MTLPLHPLVELFPAIEGMEFDSLVASVKANGLRDAITVFEGAVIDGRNRQRACDAAGVDAHYETLPIGTDPLQFVLDKNLSRRHLNETQRAMVAAKIATMKQGDNQHAQICATSQTYAAKLLNVGRRSVQYATEVRHNGVAELQRAVEAGNVSVSAAAEIAVLAEDQQRDLVARGPDKCTATAKQLREAKKAKSKHRRPRGASAPASIDPEPRHDVDLRRLHVAWEAACSSARSEFMEFAVGEEI